MATLQELLNSPNQSVRLKAALAAGTYPNPDQIDILIVQCASESDFFVRDTLSWALMRHEVSKVVERLGDGGGSTAGAAAPPGVGSAHGRPGGGWPACARRGVDPGDTAPR